jgi:hypothetical protein
VRADDQPGARDRRAAREDLLDVAFARRLEPAVVAGDLLRRRVLELRERRRLVEAGAIRRGVGRDRRDEEVVRRVAQQLRRCAYEPRYEAGGVDDGVPLPSLERVQVAVAVAAQLLRVREEPRIRPPAVEERQLVPARERLLGDRPAEELRAAEDQKADSASSRASTSSAVL